MSTTANNYAAALQGRAPGRRPTAASRQGRRHVGAYVPPDTARQLRVIAAQEDSSVQQLIEQAIELLFADRAIPITSTTTTTTGAAPAVSTADQARIAAALEASSAANTTRAYRSGQAAWQRWAAEHGHHVMPAAPVAVAAYLAHRAEQGASVATVREARAAISAAHRQDAADDPCKHPGVLQVLKGLSRTGKGRAAGRCRAPRLARRRSRRGRRRERRALTRRSPRCGNHPGQCPMRGCGSAKRQRWTLPTCNARSTAAAP